MVQRLFLVVFCAGALLFLAGGCGGTTERAPTIADTGLKLKERPVPAAPGGGGNPAQQKGGVASQ
jgi:hypothetical protein